MKRQIRIVLKKGSNGGYLEFKFQTKTKEGNAVTKIFSRQTKQLILENQLMAGDEMMTLKIGLNNPEYSVKWDDSPSFKSAENDTHKELAALLKTHRTVNPVKRVKPDGSYEYDSNPNLTVHLFDYLDETENHTQNIATLHHFYNAANRVRGMNLEQRTNLLYHFGFGGLAKDMSSSSVLAYLIDPAQGIALSRNQYDTKTIDGQKIPRSYLEYFTEVYQEGDENVRIKTLIYKAIVIQSTDKRTIIERKQDGSYVINDTQILGGNLDDVMFHLLRTPKDLDYIQRMVNTYDTIKDDDIPALLLRKGIKMTEETVVEQTKKEIKTNEYFQEQSNLLRVCREKFRMIVGEELTIEELNKKIEEAKTAWYRLNFFPKVKEEIEKHPEWTYDRIIAEKERAEAERKDAKKIGRPKKVLTS